MAVTFFPATLSNASSRKKERDRARAQWRHANKGKDPGDAPRPLLMRKGLRKDRHRSLVAERSKQRSEEGWLFVIRGRGLM